MATLLNKDKLLIAFRTMVREKKTEEYEALIDKYNKLVVEATKTGADLVVAKTYQTNLDSLIQSTNVILKKIGLTDRLDRYDQLAVNISNVLWKLHVHKARSVS